MHVTDFTFSYIFLEIIRETRSLSERKTKIYFRMHTYFKLQIRIKYTYLVVSYVFFENKFLDSSFIKALFVCESRNIFGYNSFSKNKSL